MFRFITLTIFALFSMVYASSATAQIPNDSLTQWEKEWQTLTQELKQEILLLEQQIEKLAATANTETQPEREALQRQLKELNREFELILQKTKLEWEELSREIKQRMEAAENE